MEKELVIKLIEGGGTKEDVTKFVIEYVKLKKNIVPTVQQVSAILMMMQLGNFSLEMALSDAAKELGLQILYINKNDLVLKTTVYEC